ncbi:(Dimethylallyl)adenosine tRNA methylthiotransferase MiaB,(dimethylallyl)adenosine tRNA methylthiotransferase,MiaB-like tRNA modifying enzyme,Radical SAM superfamily [Chlamydia serpentis]|uniref:(Dimethylallyl)adenosine tRNA methylthiotransferase MiaB,(Dimethylallyl)adenosine tRNA methylthiotransferase,MiaB-like tRNA modifying enzyme,Radical SAM superfamily n=1 Tax=Chlamydia serpentis TaxID=1967782 RepID=A0A2R8FAY7_9CHLA|nr:tRNA (N(6)-L-threonylcarbamoyladenosine(37)-C(2))-methylthiotransferase MtaB [Chlamydia serpentis]SPN73600.1 (Dimethylallyl)adenosine tRNA methylthiotransferase MiaB,(dimethylallyl)adenosine tRNA methylthiotransferase,MiaB-like tRNA modifying enzyme,Radical SAM superfamily [Chlamydia serpentis]
MTVTEVKRTFKLVCLGCRVNQYEIQAYRDQLTILGYQEIVDSEIPVDLCIINTCAVTSSAESSGRHAVRQLCRQNPEAHIVVTGCLGESDKNFFASLDRKCTIVPNKEKSHLIDKIFPHDDKFPEFKIHSFEGKSRAFIKVQDGCNSFCSYCIIPYLRGRSVSRPASEILREIQGIIEQGYREVVIAGINVGDYRDGELSLGSLVKQIDQIPGIDRIRISSIDPDDIDEELYDAITSSRHTCPSSHLVLQSGSNSILKRMNRKYSRGDFLDCVDKFRAYDPNYAFTTDVIVGFPGESDQDFEDTLRIIEDVGFIKVHSFPYSSRPRTKASTFDNQLPQQVIHERKKHLAEVAKKVSQKEMQKRLGATTEVLVEQITDQVALGHSPYFEMVSFPIVEKIAINTLVTVCLHTVEDKGLIGECI